MITKRREEVRGSWEKNVGKKCWQTPSRNSVPNPMYGRGGAAGDAITHPGRAAGKVLAGDCGENG